jgi:hypothetical protein
MFVTENFIRSCGTPLVGQTHQVANEIFGGSGEVSGRTYWDPGLRRPYFDKNGKAAVSINRGRTTLVKGEQVPIREHVTCADMVANGLFMPVWNATTLSKEQWLRLDEAVLRAARYRLRLTEDIASLSGTYGGFDGMATMVLEHQTMSDPGEAIVDMTGLTMGRTDQPQFQLEGLPLPITHSDFAFDSRTLAASRNKGQPLDVSQGEASSRRVAESIEKQTIGVNTGVIYGGASTYAGGYGRTSQVYGLTTFPTRLTYTSITAPTSTNQATILANVLAMKDRLTANKFYGPFMVYTSNDWDQYMDGDYILSGGNVATQTLRQRIKAIEGILDVRRLDMLFSANIQTDPTINTTTIVGTTGVPRYTGPGGEGFVASATSPATLLMVQMTPDVIRMVNGMGITTVQWETVGGMQQNFKVMGIQVPQIRADFYGNCGLLHGTTA